MYGLKTCYLQLLGLPAAVTPVSHSSPPGFNPPAVRPPVFTPKRGSPSAVPGNLTGSITFYNFMLINGKGNN